MNKEIKMADNLHSQDSLQISGGEISQGPAVLVRISKDKLGLTLNSNGKATTEGLDNAKYLIRKLQNLKLADEKIAPDEMSIFNGIIALTQGRDLLHETAIYFSGHRDGYSKLGGVGNLPKDSDILAGQYGHYAGVLERYLVQTITADTAKTPYQNPAKAQEALTLLTSVVVAPTSAPLVASPQNIRTIQEVLGPQAADIYTRFQSPRAHNEPINLKDLNAGLALAKSLDKGQNSDQSILSKIKNIFSPQQTQPVPYSLKDEVVPFSNIRVQDLDSQAGNIIQELETKAKHTKEAQTPSIIPFTTQTYELSDAMWQKAVDEFGISKSQQTSDIGLNESVWNGDNASFELDPISFIKGSELESVIKSQLDLIPGLQDSGIINFADLYGKKKDVRIIEGIHQDLTDPKNPRRQITIAFQVNDFNFDADTLGAATAMFAFGKDGKAYSIKAIEGQQPWLGWISSDFSSYLSTLGVKVLPNNDVLGSIAHVENALEIKAIVGADGITYGLIPKDNWEKGLADFKKQYGAKAVAIPTPGPVRYPSGGDKSVLPEPGLNSVPDANSVSVEGLVMSNPNKISLDIIAARQKLVDAEDKTVEKTPIVAGGNILGPDGTKIATVTMRAFGMPSRKPVENDQMNKITTSFYVNQFDNLMGGPGFYYKALEAYKADGDVSHLTIKIPQVIDPSSSPVDPKNVYYVDFIAVPGKYSIEPSFQDKDSAAPYNIENGEGKYGSYVRTNTDGTQTLVLDFHNKQNATVGMLLSPFAGSTTSFDLFAVYTAAGLFPFENGDNGSLAKTTKNIEVAGNPFWDYALGKTKLPASIDPFSWLTGKQQ